MKYLYIKQKVFSLAGKFTVKDERQNDVYFVEGSFLRIPKTFSITDAHDQEIATITKKPFSFLPTFFVEVIGQDIVTIKKQFTFIKARYTIDGAGIKVQGNLWDMNFQVLRDGEEVGSVQKKWFTWGDSYEVQINDEESEAIVIALVVAISYVKAAQAAAAGGGA